MNIPDEVIREAADRVGRVLWADRPSLHEVDVVRIAGPVIAEWARKEALREAEEAASPFQIGDEVTRAIRALTEVGHKAPTSTPSPNGLCDCTPDGAGCFHLRWDGILQLTPAEVMDLLGADSNTIDRDRIAETIARWDSNTPEGKEPEILPDHRVLADLIVKTMVELASSRSGLTTGSETP